MHINEMINRFQGAKLIGNNSYQCICPSHPDKKASLTITEEDNKILMHCHAGCDTNSILSKVGLIEKDLFNNVQQKPQLVAEYIYKDEEGSPLYKVMRFEPKNFMQAKCVNGEWIYKMAGVRYVLYNLPNVIKSDIVYFVEGEKDADNLNKIGLVATTTAGGASGFKKRAAEYVRFLEAKTVYIIPDNDKAGYSYAEDIKNALKESSAQIKILKLSDEVKDLGEKQDISDIILKYGKEKTLEILGKLQSNNEINPCFELRADNILSTEVFEKLYEYEISDIDNYFKLYNEIKLLCNAKRITGFDKSYKLYKDSKKEVVEYDGGGLFFPDLNNLIYNTNRYEISQENFIYEVIPNVGKILVCYHPILPIEKYKNLEDGSEKIKIGFYKNNEWEYLIVDKSTISSSQSIVKLSDFGIAVTSENAKYLVKYLAEIENLNQDKITTSASVSRLGWFGEDTLIPYADKYEFDNERDFPYIDEKFGQSGELKDWVEFFKERRKHNNTSRIVMASAVSSILLKKIKQPGFTLHVWGESEYGKTVACMVGQSIFGNPSQNDGKGIGINFNFTAAGLEYRLNLYNNIPLFVNEMQHQKDAKDYDKILFLISEGKGKSRATKSGGISKENNWNNVVITNGEKNIIKDNSNAGAYNRCLSCEVTDYLYKDLQEVADFAKENYGTVIREILNHLPNYDLKTMFKNIYNNLDQDDTTNKQKILEAIILLGDKLLTDIIFKDEYYLTTEDFENKIVKKKDVVVEERAFELVREWYMLEKRHFLKDEGNSLENQDIKVEIYGRDMKFGYIAIVPMAIKKVLSDNGYDYFEVLNAWKRKGYLKCDRNSNTQVVRLNGNRIRCVVLDIRRGLEEEVQEEFQLPF